MPTKIFRAALIALLCLAVSCPFFAAAEGMAGDFTDYAAAVRLNPAGETNRLEVQVVNYVDGDTVHFAVPESVVADGVLKARFLAVNAPESTGRIEEYGKAASAFTKEKLSTAASIVIESDDGAWNLDSTGGRYLVWVWYKPDAASQYRNLNIELLQNGLAVGSAASSNRYGQTCVAAVSQAKNRKLNVYSGQPDPDFFYGEAVELTIRELREHPEEYEGKKVAFSGGITVNYGGSVYVEQFDGETGRYYGMPVYYGYNLSGEGLSILSVSNEARIVGSFQFYETGGVWQVTDVKYRMMKPEDPGNIRKLGEGYLPAYAPITAAELAGESGRDALAASVSLTGLSVQDAWAQQSGDSAYNGAMTLRCDQEGAFVRIYTAPLRGEDGALLTPEMFLNRTIDVTGIVDLSEGECVVRVFAPENISVQP